MDRRPKLTMDRGRVVQLVVTGAVVVSALLALGARRLYRNPAPADYRAGVLPEVVVTAPAPSYEMEGVDVVAPRFAE